MHRRDFVRSSSLAVLAGFPASLSPRATDTLENLLAGVDAPDPLSLAGDDAFWMGIRKSYVTSIDLIDFDNANTGPTPPAVYNAIRVPPGVYATTSELDPFVDAVKKVAGLQSMSSQRYSQ